MYSSPVVKDSDAPSLRATCAVVGTVSPNRLYLEPHGNFNPNFEKTSLETSKLQFQLVPPSRHPEFEDDFNRGVKVLEILQKIACKDGPEPEHFVVTDGGKKALKFSSPLFEKRVNFFFFFCIQWTSSNPLYPLKDLPYDRGWWIITVSHTLTPGCYLLATDEEDWSNDYPITEKFKDIYDDIVWKWRVTPLPAFDASGKFIKAHNLEESLKGSMVLVYFELRHYAIKNRKNNLVAGNTFSAIATQVKILERGADCRPSPYKSQLMKGPKTLPRTSTQRKDQISAVKAFHPGKTDGTHQCFDKYVILLINLFLSPQSCPEFLASWVIFDFRFQPEEGGQKKGPWRGSRGDRYGWRRAQSKQRHQEKENLGEVNIRTRLSMIGLFFPLFFFWVVWPPYLFAFL